MRCEDSLVNEVRLTDNDMDFEMQTLKCVRSEKKTLDKMLRVQTDHGVILIQSAYHHGERKRSRGGHTRSGEVEFAGEMPHNLNDVSWVSTKSMVVHIQRTFQLQSGPRSRVLEECTM